MIIKLKLGNIWQLPIKSISSIYHIYNQRLFNEEFLQIMDDYESSDDEVRTEQVVVEIHNEHLNEAHNKNTKNIKECDHESKTKANGSQEKKESMTPPQISAKKKLNTDDIEEIISIEEENYKELNEDSRREVKLVSAPNLKTRQKLEAKNKNIKINDEENLTEQRESILIDYVLLKFPSYLSTACLWHTQIADPVSHSISFFFIILFLDILSYNFFRKKCFGLGNFLGLTKIMSECFYFSFFSDSYPDDKSGFFLLYFVISAVAIILNCLLCNKIYNNDKVIKATLTSTLLQSGAVAFSFYIFGKSLASYVYAICAILYLISCFTLSRKRSKIWLWSEGIYFTFLIAVIQYHLGNFVIKKNLHLNKT